MDCENCERHKAILGKVGEPLSTYFLCKFCRQAFNCATDARIIMLTELVNDLTTARNNRKLS